VFHDGWEFISGMLGDFVSRIGFATRLGGSSGEQQDVQSYALLTSALLRRTGQRYFVILEEGESESIAGSEPW